jgi:hypothetical protein
MEALTIPVTIYVLATTNPFLPTLIMHRLVTCHNFLVDVLVSTKTLEVPIPPLEPIDIIGMQVNALRARKNKSQLKPIYSKMLLKTRSAAAVHRPLSD